MSDLHEFQHSSSHTLLKNVKHSLNGNIHVSSKSLVKSGTDVHIMLFSTYEFQENQYSRSHTFS